MKKQIKLKNETGEILWLYNPTNGMKIRLFTEHGINPHWNLLLEGDRLFLLNMKGYLNLKNYKHKPILMYEE